MPGCPVRNSASRDSRTSDAHHPIVDEPNHRLYAGFRDGSGQIGAWDISEPARPRLVWSYDTSPPGRGPHTVSPIVYQTVPNFTGDALPRRYALVTDELGNECASGVKSRMTMFDITFESNPMPVATFQVPIGHFCDSGRGNFGPHQHAETVNGELNPFTDKLAWLAYVNAGVRVIDISDPYHLTEVGHLIPKTNVPDARRPIELTDVDIDHRGFVYADRSLGPVLHGSRRHARCDRRRRAVHRHRPVRAPVHRRTRRCDDQLK